MTVTLFSQATIDAPFGPAMAAAGRNYYEFGFGGSPLDSPAPSGIVSAFLAGDQPAEAREWISKISKAGGRFRLLFPERYYAPALEAHRLFTGKHLGTPIHFLSKIQVHPATLLSPDRVSDPKHWLREPLLNRIPLLVWMMGPVRDARVVFEARKGAVTCIAMFRHTHPQRLSILEFAVSGDFTQGGKPALLERFECTGSDGFLRVHGGLDPARAFPRLELHRGAIESVQRDLPREPAELYSQAVRRAKEDSASHCSLTEHYLDACELIVRHISNPTNNP
jgi:predicted dehydrogenase